MRRRALAGVEVVYYLLHSMAAAGDFAARDRDLAQGFAASAREAGTRRIVYLSGLHPAGPLSAHLASRVEVGEILLASGVPTAVLQAGVVLGEGSASFEMLRHLTERLPAMVGPRWLGNRIQPIALPDVVHYLVRAADLPPDVNRTIDLGMDEVLTYSEMMRRYARVAGLLPRFVATVPVLTPWLASHWVGLVTPVRAAIAKPLVGSLIHDAVRSEQDAARILGDPPGGTVGFDDAVRAALAGRDPHRWARTVAGVGVAVAGCAVLGSLATAPDTRWYRRLRKPVWQPPAAAFPWCGARCTRPWRSPQPRRSPISRSRATHARRGDSGARWDSTSCSTRAGARCSSVRTGSTPRPCGPRHWRPHRSTWSGGPAPPGRARRWA